MVHTPPPVRLCALCQKPLPEDAPAPAHNAGEVCASCRAVGQRELEREFPDVALRFSLPERAALANYAIKFRVLKPLFRACPTRVIVRLLVVERALELLGVPETSDHARSLRAVILGTGCGECGATLSLEEVSSGRAVVCPECHHVNNPPGGEAEGATS